jgi:hypothetical protein
VAALVLQVLLTDALHHAVAEISRRLGLLPSGFPSAQGFA